MWVISPDVSTSRVFKKKIMMKRKIYSVICAVLLNVMSTQAAEKPGIWDGIKEAAKGIVWMVRFEVCKIDMALFSKSGLNIANANYKCEHTDHKLENYNPNK